MVRSFGASLAKGSLVFTLAATVSMAGAQTISFGNSPGGYPGTVSYAGGTAALMTGTAINLSIGPSQFSGAQYDFFFETGGGSAGSVFAPGGSVKLVLGSMFSGGIDLDGDATVDILSGATIFTGTLGTTTVNLRPDPCAPSCIGSTHGISATFTTNDLHPGYAAALGVPTSGYSGNFLFGVNDWGSPSNAGQPLQVGWREVSLTAPIPEPQTYALMLAGLGLLGVAVRRRSRSAAATHEIGARVVSLPPPRGPW